MANERMMSLLNWGWGSRGKYERCSNDPFLRGDYVHVWRERWWRPRERQFGYLLDVILGGIRDGQVGARVLSYKRILSSWQLWRWVTIIASARYNSAEFYWFRQTTIWCLLLHGFEHNRNPPETSSGIHSNFYHSFCTQRLKKSLSLCKLWPGQIICV